MRAVILAGGKGTRLAPYTTVLPKPLMPVGDKTMMEIILDNFRGQGFHRFHAVVNHKRDLIKSYFQEARADYGLEFVDEDTPLGTAGGLALLHGKVTSAFILTNCDVIAKVDYRAIMAWHLDARADLTILGVRRKMQIPYGVIEMGPGNIVNGITEKPCFQHVIMSGIYVLEPSVLGCIPPGRPFGFDELIVECQRRDFRVRCYEIADGWFDMGEFEEYKSLLRHFDGLKV